jgi:hypothetical protein
MREAGGGSGAISPQPERWVQALAVRAPDTLIIEYWLGEDAAYAWTVSGSGIRVFALGPSAPILDSARTFQRIAAWVRDNSP